MDELGLIRQLRGDPRALDIDARERARGRLLERAAGARGPRRPRRPRWLAPALATSAAVGALAGAIVLASGGAGPRELTEPGQTLPADATEALRRLARVAAGRPAPPDLRTGGFWYVRDRDDSPRESGDVRWRQTYVHEVWLDADGTGRFRTAGEGEVRFLTDADRTRWERQGRPELPSEAGADGLQSGPIRRWREWTMRNLYGLPREPAALKRGLHKYDDFTQRRLADGSTMTPENAVTSRVSSFAGLLASMPLPSDLRAALFELLAREPGLTFAGTIDVHGRRGWGIDTPLYVSRHPRERFTAFTRVVIDPASSAVIATQNVRDDVVNSEREYLASGHVADTDTVPPDGLAAP